MHYSRQEENRGIYRVSKKNASGNSANSIADKKRWSDFCAQRWATLQYVVFTQQQTAALLVKHYVALKRTCS